MMMKRIGMAIAVAALAAAGCSSPVDSARAPEDGVRADASARTTAADSGAARNGGNLMGGH